MDNFIKILSEIYEVEPDGIVANTDFRNEIDGFNSLIGFSIMIMMEDEYNARVSVEEFLECKTVGDLYGKCVKEENA